MHRTSVILPEELDRRLRYEARRRGVSVAEVVREAVEQHVPAPAAGEPLSFFGIGHGGLPDDASEHVDEYVGEAMRRRGFR